MPDLQAKIDRVRRATRNQDILDLVDELQNRLAAENIRKITAKPLSRAEIQRNYRLRKKNSGK